MLASVGIPGIDSQQQPSRNPSPANTIYPETFRRSNRPFSSKLSPLAHPYLVRADSHIPFSWRKHFPTLLSRVCKTTIRHISPCSMSCEYQIKPENNSCLEPVVAHTADVEEKRSPLGPFDKIAIPSASNGRSER